LKQLDYIATQKADLVVTNSYFIQQAVQRIYQIDASVSYHGVDHETFRPLEVPKENMVISVGALTPNKGFRFIIESLGHIHEASRPKFVIVSNYQEAEERNRLEQLAASHQVCLSCHTMIPNEELVRLYNVAQLVVYAPLMEPFGLVPLEAMACGTPVVGVREGGIPESVVDGHTGLLVERDARAFAQAIEKLLMDKRLTAQLGQQARQYIVEKWTWDKAVQSLETHLQNVTPIVEGQGPQKRRISEEKLNVNGNRLGGIQETHE
jgi:glycosyltransferase involved in cell wall biosynthesis